MVTTFCPEHPETPMICPRCIARKGGASTAKKYGTLQLAAWGSAGGRRRKKAKKKAK